MEGYSGQSRQNIELPTGPVDALFARLTRVETFDKISNLSSVAYFEVAVLIGITYDDTKVDSCNFSTGLTSPVLDGAGQDVSLFRSDPRWSCVGFPFSNHPQRGPIRPWRTIREISYCPPSTEELKESLMTKDPHRELMRSWERA